MLEHGEIVSGLLISSLKSINTCFRSNPQGSPPKPNQRHTDNESRNASFSVNGGCEVDILSARHHAVKSRNAEST